MAQSNISAVSSSRGRTEHLPTATPGGRNRSGDTTPELLLLAQQRGSPMLAQSRSSEDEGSSSASELEDEAPLTDSPAAPGNTDADEDTEQLAPVKELLSGKCDCTGVNHMTVISKQQAIAFNTSLKALDRREKDIYMLGILAACMRAGKVDHGRRPPQDARKRFTYRYRIHGQDVCRKVFMILCGIGKKRLNRLHREAETFSCNPRAHGNVGRTAAHAFPREVLDGAFAFIGAHAARHGLATPAAPVARGRGKEVLVHLPASWSYKAVHQLYTQQAAPGSTAVGYTTFRKIWKTRLPHVQIMAGPVPQTSVSFP